MNSSSRLEEGLIHGFIDGTQIALEEYKPRLIINDPNRGEKVLTSIVDELGKCDEFLFSVAFVTETGVIVLLNTLKELADRGIKGKILASQYLNFSDPKALRKLLSLENIELKIITQDASKMHTKGYIFRKDKEYTIIVGSSNLTQSALCENKEWNLKVSSSEEGALVKNTLHEFYYMFDQATPVTESWLDEYRKIYDIEKKIRQNTEESIRDNFKSEIVNFNHVSPNIMQQEALHELEKVRLLEEVRALIISATGTGKTYLSAFDVKKFNPKRFLFVVHREQIARAALKSFRRVFGQDKKMAVLSGNHKDLDAEFIFSTIQTISKDDILHRFDSRDFDYIAIDEVHRAGAVSYRKIIDYFKPKFLMGMSATPERTDGFDIYELFHHNVPYEIRLNGAMKAGMICPFHYFGVTELTINGSLIDDKTTFNHLVSDERVAYIRDKIEFYGYSGNRVKGLVFCSTNEEARELSYKFNLLGYRTVALSGANTQEERMEAVERLGQESHTGGLDYIFTVDIFNEGVDIPEVNQVIMLRPTKSAIIFVQQLGRGLRKIMNKEYVVVLDFIGNYDNNYLIPIALSGDQTYNKDNIRKYIKEVNKTIYGSSTVNFDKITRERIYKAIDRANFNDLKLIKESYMMLRQRLGRIPKLNEFQKNGAIDIERIFAKKKSYHNFLKMYEKDYDIKLNDVQERFVEFVSQKYVNGKRPHELEFIKIIMSGKNDVIPKLEKVLLEEYKILINENTILNLVNQFTQNYATGSSKSSYADVVFIEGNGDLYNISSAFETSLRDSNFKDMMSELVEMGLENNREKYSDRYGDSNFVLYQKYNYDDVCRLFDWDTAHNGQIIGGYKFDDKTKTFPVFINYDKSEELNETIKYPDRFVTTQDLLAISKNSRKIDSNEILKIYNSIERGYTIHLFVRKNKDDKNSKEFYYLGTMQPVGEPVQKVMKNTNSNVVEIHYRLHTSVREDLFDYIITD